MVVVVGPPGSPRHTLLHIHHGQLFVQGKNSMIFRLHNLRFLSSSSVKCCGAGAASFWSEPEPVQRSSSGSTIDKNRLNSQ